MHGSLANLAGGPLDDSRVELRVGDVVDLLAGADEGFDVILLDADNGPEAVMYQPNRFVYGREGLESVKRALVPDGVAGVWSADPSAPFERELDAAGVKWRRIALAANGSRGNLEHSIDLARRR